jgi:uncharacterized membrane protein YtjA (UPF0391 family)
VPPAGPWESKTLFFIFLVIFVVLLLAGLFVGRKVSGG